MNLERCDLTYRGMEIKGEGQWVQFEDIEDLLKAVKNLVECKDRHQVEHNLRTLTLEWEQIK